MGNLYFLLPAAPNEPDPDLSINSNLNCTNFRRTVTTGKSMKCWYTNSCPLFNKFNKLKFRLVTDIVTVTEVNCKFSCSDVEFNIDGYRTIQSTTTNLHQRDVYMVGKFGRGKIWQIDSF